MWWVSQIIRISALLLHPQGFAESNPYLLIIPDRVCRHNQLKQLHYSTESEVIGKFPHHQPTKKNPPLKFTYSRCKDVDLEEFNKDKIRLWAILAVTGMY